MNNRQILIIAGISGAIAVGLGAFGAHGLEPMLRLAGRLDTFETAVRYHFYHTLLLLGLAALEGRIHRKYLRISASLAAVGIAVFSGSLYVLCLTELTWLGAVTPLGGACFIGAWIALAAGAIKKAGHF